MRCRANLARRGQAGFMAAEYALGVALLLIPVGLVVITLPEWPARQGVARVAATEAARTAVQQSDWRSATAAGAGAADEVARNYGVATGDLVVSIAGGLGRGQTVTARVAIRMPAINVTAIGGVGSWTWTAVHAEQVDQYRSFSP